MDIYAKPWYENISETSPILCSGIDISRNLDAIPFPVRLNPSQKTVVNNKICGVLSQYRLPLTRIDMSRLYPFEAVALAERYLITPEFASGTEGRELLLSPDERISIMLNEEDHIHIRSMEAGLNLKAAYQNALNIELMLENSLHFAFDEALGFLNQNPINIGTGLKAYALVHLPCLTANDAMPVFASMLSKTGFTVRGAYGDALTIKGDIYRIENSVCLGLTEDEVLTNLGNVAEQLATEEHNAADTYLKREDVHARLMEAQSRLLSANSLSIDEMTELLSCLRLGMIANLYNYPMQVIYTLLITQQPANINTANGARLSEEVQNELRANAVKKVLTDFTV